MCYLNFMVSLLHPSEILIEILKFLLMQDLASAFQNVVYKILVHPVLIFIFSDSKSVTRKLGRGRKSKATAAKVALMKIKMKALGEKGTPETERVYLSVLLPLGSVSTDKPMFFSKVG